MVRQPTCPICRTALPVACESQFFPFCSERCRDIDFFRWSDGRYAIEESLDPGRLAAEMLEAEENEREPE